MTSRSGKLLLIIVPIAISAASSCSDRHADEACYFVDDAADYITAPLYTEWCEYEAGEVTPLTEEHCPSGECIDFFITCEEVPIDHVCQTCTAEELDDKVHAALEAKYAERCPDGPRDLIDFERGCVFEDDIPISDDTKECCYTAIVVGECSLRGT